MRILVVGAGGVGSAIVAIAQRTLVLRARDASPTSTPDGPSRASPGLGEPDRFSASRIDASDRGAIVTLAREAKADVIVNAVGSTLQPDDLRRGIRGRAAPIWTWRLTLSEPHPEHPYEEPGVKLGDRQFSEHERWQSAGLLALVGIGVQPGLSDVFARYAADHLFSTIDEIAVRDGANIVVEGYAFAPTFSIWTTIEECLNPPLDLGAGSAGGTPPSRSRSLRCSTSRGESDPFECVNVEHEEVVLIPREIDCGRVTFKYGLGEEFIDVLRTLHLLGLDSKEPVDCPRSENRAERPRCCCAARPGDVG